MLLLTEGVLTYTELENMDLDEFLTISTAFSMVMDKKNKEMKKALR